MSENKRPQELSQWSGEGQLSTSIHTNGFLRYEEAYARELEHFTDVVEGDTLFGLK